MTRLLYRLRLARLRSEWEPWVEQDLAAPSFVFWSALSHLVLVLIAVALFALVTGDFPVLGAGTLLAVSWGMLLFPRGRRRLRQRDLEWQRRKWARETTKDGGGLPGS